MGYNDGRAQGGDETPRHIGKRQGIFRVLGAGREPLAAEQAEVRGRVPDIVKGSHMVPGIWVRTNKVLSQSHEREGLLAEGKAERRYKK